MNYTDAMSYLEELNKNGISLGLEREKALLERLGNPQNKIPCIHVAGTNGKGSVCAFVCSALRKAGLRVGHYQSPAILDYWDRIQINGMKISREEVAELMQVIREADSQVSARYQGNLTAFEAETAMAFLYFQEKNCDYAVIEVGMGGRLDATNVINKPVVTAITAIGMDHTAILGDTLADIAGEKAGILKEDCPAVLGVQETEAMETLLNRCDALGIQPICVQAESLHREGWSPEGQLFSYGARTHMRISLLGDYQPENASVALEVLEQLRQNDSRITEDAIAAGLQAAVWPGRFEILHRHPMVIVDGAHNPAGAERLAETLQHFENRKIRIAMAVFRDKDYETILKILSAYSDTICCFSPKGDRGLEADALASAAKKVFDQVEEADSAEQALQLLARNSAEDDIILCCGSLSVVQAVTEATKSVFGEQKPEKWNRILQHPLFQNTLKRIEEQEVEREFCHHDLTHLLDVCRISWIQVLEQKMPLSKDEVYGAALLHDLGRCRQYEEGIPHHIASGEIAREILDEVGYSEEETAHILEAILFHGEVQQDTPGLLAKTLYQADKESRNCFACEARSRCKWPVTQQNSTLRC